MWPSLDLAFPTGRSTLSLPWSYSVFPSPLSSLGFLTSIRKGSCVLNPFPPEAHHRFSIASIIEFVLICVLVITVGYLYVDRLSLQNRLVVHESADSEEPAVPNPEQYRAIAVLPFADMSEAGDQAWFAEGIAEELLIALSQVEQLSVMARTSSFAFKDTDKTIAEIADILGVQAVLEGSVRRSGERARITAQLG
jgi:TolB-like protein